MNSDGIKLNDIHYLKLAITAVPYIHQELKLKDSTFNWPPTVERSEYEL